MTSAAAATKTRSIRDLVSPEEWAMRVDLACANRAAAFFGWDDQLYAHVTGRVPGESSHYLIQPYYYAFEEVNASMLHKVDDNNNHVIPSDEMAHPFAMPYHRTIYKNFPDMNCVIHLHVQECGAVGLQKNGLLPITQAGLISGQVGYHSYEGLAFNEEEGYRMVENVRKAGPDCQALLLSGHGVTTMGRNVADAFMICYNLVRGCQMQVMAQAGGGELRYPDERTIHVTRDEEAFGIKPRFSHFTGICWDAMKRKMHRHSPGFDE